MAVDKAKEGDLTLFNQLVSGALPAGTPTPKVAETQQPKSQSKLEREWLSIFNDLLFEEI
jgi:hypothetical protein